VELKRNIHNDLLRWKQRDSGKVLELKGARQRFRNQRKCIPESKNFQESFYAIL
jgi:hypothetical protein